MRRSSIWKILGLLNLCGVVGAVGVASAGTSWKFPTAFQKGQFAWTNEREYRTEHLRLKVNDVFQLEQVETDAEGWVLHIKGNISTSVECRILGDNGWKDFPAGLPIGPSKSCGESFDEAATLNDKEELTPEENFALARSGEMWCESFSAVVKKKAVKAGEDNHMICENREGPLASDGSAKKTDGLDDLAVQKLLHPYQDCYWEETPGSSDKVMKCD